MDTTLFAHYYSTYFFVLFLQDTPGIDWIATVQDFGILAAITLLTVWGIWRYIVPFVIKHIDNFEKERSERYEALVQELKQTRVSLEERTEKGESRILLDRDRFVEAYNNSSEAQFKLAVALDKLTTIVDELNSQIMSLEQEVIYLRTVQKALFGKRIYAELGLNGDNHDHHDNNDNNDNKDKRG